MTKLTTKDLTTAFDVTAMTIANWRAGSATKAALPYQKSGHHVTFAPGKVQQWAKRNGVPILAPEALAGAAERTRPGPKPQLKQKTP